MSVLSYIVVFARLQPKARLVISISAKPGEREKGWGRGWQLPIKHVHTAYNI
jgi:hypothetical protein